MKIKIIIFVCLILILASGYFLERKYIVETTTDITSQPILVNQNNSSKNIPTNTINSDNSSIEPISIPPSYYIKNVSFQTQAPNANWDATHEEACEEAALIIVNYYLKNQTLTTQEMENQIQSMISWEDKNWGAKDKDLTISEEKRLATDYYGLSSTAKQINSIDDIKQEIAKDHLVIVPAAGRLLKNPNFTAPGPVYHMLVVRGYTESSIITNDPGTRRGENYAYSNDVFWNAIHDWNGTKDNITSGQKTILIF